MKIKIQHSTIYQYGGSVVQSFNEARLQPMSDEAQKCLEHRVTITPPVAVTRDYHDFYGNQVHYFELHAPHTELIVFSEAQVETGIENSVEKDFSMDRESLTQRIQQIDILHEYLISSPYISLVPEFWRFALDSGGDDSDLWKVATNISQTIFKNFTYQPGSTHVHTLASEALKLKTGVCQDYSHVLLAALRSLKIPARYVSGYLYEKREGTFHETPVAEMASHAWVEVYLPNHGWKGLDPTHGCFTDERYVKVAVGRDYSDAAPFKGAYRGTQVQHLKVSVRMEELVGAPQTV